MGQRIDLHRELLAVTDSGNVYFQPPEGLKMRYPCIVYQQDKIQCEHANNLPYVHHHRYSITIIDEDPESPICERMSTLPLCQYDRSFVSDNFYHTVFTLYY